MDTLHRLKLIAIAIKKHIIMQNLNNFEPWEFNCKCGKCGLGINDMNTDLLWRLDEARQSAGIQFVLTSAMRCHDHNKAEGGSRNSSHLIGHAVDIKAKDDNRRWRIIESLMLVGFNRIGITNGGNVHVDNDPEKNTKRFWV